LNNSTGQSSEIKSNNFPFPQPALVKRDREISDTGPLRDLLLTLDREVPEIKVFNPFPIICPVGQEFCSSYSGSQRIFSDSNHLTDAGALKL
jgi:hypothetical protein